MTDLFFVRYLKEEPLTDLLSIFSNKVEATYPANYPLVRSGFHGFLYTVYQAYSEHRPLSISPDMIWLLIAQGFSNHVNFNATTMNDVFPYLEDKKTLIIRNNNIQLGKPNSPWHEAPVAFCKQISKEIESDLVDVLSADFSTTSLTEKMVSEITIMNTMKTYFEYIQSYCICGIPTITLEGKPSDWEQLLKKANALRKYDMVWWIDQLKPLLQEFVQTSKGFVDVDFWRNMFKIHTSEDYGHPKNIDGWLINFYPYDRKGQKIDLKTISSINVDNIFKELPSELVTVPFIYRIEDESGQILKDINMEYWAGFIGLKQDKTDFTVRPEIGWFVTYKEDTAILETSKKYHEETYESYDNVAYYHLTKFPTEVLKRKEWDGLRLFFNGTIQVPDEIKTLNIRFFSVSGKIDTEGVERLKNLLPDTQIYVNDIHINPTEIDIKCNEDGTYDECTYEEFDTVNYFNFKTFPKTILKRKKWEQLNIYFDGKVQIPDAIQDLEINCLDLFSDIELEEVEKKRIIALLPNSKITVNWQHIE